MPRQNAFNPDDTTREQNKERYSHKENVEAKWLDQYGNVSLEDNYQKNRDVLTEVFNMLDAVMSNYIDAFCRSHKCIRATPHERPNSFVYEGDDGKSVSFQSPTSFYNRVRALRAIGYPISDDLFYGTRLLRNLTTHLNQTIVLQNRSLSYEDTMRAILPIADTLILLGMLDPELRVPDFEKLRVHEGESLSSGAYTIKALIGEGGMSRVYRAVQNRVGRDVAVKELKPGTYASDLIEHECELLLRLHHEHIPQIHDVFYENATYYIVMTLIDGVTLEEYLKENGKLPEDTALSISHALLDVLAYLHSPEAGIVFADLSPDNIMIDKNGMPNFIDFGISSQIESRQALPAATLGYSAPEVFANAPLDQRTDIYSFGWLLRFLCTGLNPGEQSEVPTSELIGKQRIVQAINRCTAKNPEERYPDIESLLSDLFPGSVSAERPGSKRRGIMAVSAALLLAAVAGGGLYYTSRKNAQEAETAAASSYAYNAGILPSFEESGLTDHAMDWKDENLETKIREVTGIYDGDIMLSDVWPLQELYLTNGGITDISALEEMSNLSTLYLDGNQIADISPLSGMDALQFLNLNGNQIQDLSSLKGLTGLTHLEVEDNLLENMESLAGLSQLDYLDIRNNNVSGISCLQDLTALTFLDIEGNPINTEELTVLTALSGLQYLNLSFCDIEELPDLSSMTGLEDLYLGHNAITDLSALQGLSSVTSLELQNNPLGPDEDVLLPLADMVQLKWLDLEYTGVSDISPLSGLESLDHLDVKGNAITDYSPLSGKPNLVYLDAAENDYAGSLDCLADLTQLTYLDLHGNQIEDLSPLAESTKLEVLYLQNNAISDISALHNMASLRILDISGNQIEDYSPIEGLRIEEIIR